MRLAKERSYRDFMAREIEWPQAASTGEVFDLGWYNTGTAKLITGNRTSWSLSNPPRSAQ